MSVLLGAAQAGTYNVVGIVGGILGIVGLIGASFAVLRSSIATNTIKLLQANNAALHDQNGQQAQQITLLQQQVKTQDAQIDLLKEMVSGKKVLDELSLAVERNHQEVMGVLTGSSK